MNSMRFILLGLAFLLGAGCSGGVKEEQIQVKAANDPIANAKTVLQRYADGQPLSSEVTSFPFLVEEVRKVDSAKADVLQTGLEDIQKSPQQAGAKARALLGKL